MTVQERIASIKAARKAELAAQEKARLAAIEEEKKQNEQGLKDAIAHLFADANTPELANCYHLVREEGKYNRQRLVAVDFDFPGHLVLTAYLVNTGPTWGHWQDACRASSDEMATWTVPERGLSFDSLADALLAAETGESVTDFEKAARELLDKHGTWVGGTNWWTQAGIPCPSHELVAAVKLEMVRRCGRMSAAEAGHVHTHVSERK